MAQANIGLVGLGVMGRNLALNFESKGFSVAAFNIEPEVTDAFVAGPANGKKITGCKSYEELCANLERPRKIMMMVTAGKAVDSVIEALLPHLEPGDILIDGGNSHFPDTIRRTRYVESKGLLFVGSGVSGGEEGALKGPSLMPGGSQAAWTHIQPLFQAIAAKVADGSPCCQYMGPDGAGHYVKMVHNGIEYGDMQLISEAYWLMKNILGLSALEQHAVFKRWNEGELDSYLIDITQQILAKTDPETGKPMVDIILDTAGQKGTGKWTSVSALDMGTPAPTIAEAVFARCLSAVKDERVAASKVLTGPSLPFTGDKEAFVNDIEQALYASKVCSYAQGFQLMRYAAKEYGWTLDFGNIALVWRGGCIIRARFLERIKEAFSADPACVNLLLTPFFRGVIEKAQPAWRRVISTAVLHGVPVPAFSSALSYYDAYRSAQLPANILQAQRDFFGAHTYERVDKPRKQFFHTEWLG